ncbi:MAG: hypothetical protein OCC49_16645 [Fibrobacterales bacterium]
MSLEFHQIILLLLCIIAPIATGLYTTKRTSWSRVVLPRLIVFYIFGLLTALFEIGRGVYIESDYELLLGAQLLAGLLIGNFVFIKRSNIDDGSSE